MLPATAIYTRISCQTEHRTAASGPYHNPETNILTIRPCCGLLCWSLHYTNHMPYTNRGHPHKEQKAKRPCNRPYCSPQLDSPVLFWGLLALMGNLQTPRSPDLSTQAGRFLTSRGAAWPIQSYKNILRSKTCKSAHGAMWSWNLQARDSAPFKHDDVQFA